MKKKLHILIPVLVMFVAAGFATDTEAGLFGRNKNKDRVKNGTWRFHRSPTMGFTSGTLSRDSFTGWELDGVRVVLSDDCKAYGAGGEAYRPREGDKVLVMGPRRGDTIVAWQIRHLTADNRGRAGGRKQMSNWNGTDPTVGEAEGPR